MLTEVGGEDRVGVERALEVEERRRARGEEKRKINPISPHNISTMLIIQKKEKSRKEFPSPSPQKRRSPTPSPEAPRPLPKPLQ